MRRMPWATYLWPGLPQLWHSGFVTALVLATGFAVLLNLLLLASFVWVELLSQWHLRLGWLAIGLVWAATAIVSPWYTAGEAAPGEATSAEGLFREALNEAGAATGEPLPIRSRAEGGIVVTPKGEKFPIRGGEAFFSRTYFQGIYEVTRGNARQPIAVNLEDTKESDLTSLSPVNLRTETAAPGARPFLFSLWPYLLLLSLVLLLLEWFFNPPIAQRRSPNTHAMPEQSA